MRCVNDTTIHSARRGVPLEHAIPGSEDEPVLGLGADADAANYVFQLGLHVPWSLTFVWELIEVGLERCALPLKGIGGKGARLGGGGIGDRDVVFVHPKVSGGQGR